MFPPLALNPKLIVLLQGCVFQIIASGGPRPYASVQYSNEDDVIATVDAGGLISSHVIGQSKELAPLLLARELSESVL